MARGAVVRVSSHAIERYRERVANLCDTDIIAALSGRAFIACARIGRGAVILPSGHRAIIENDCVITVLPHRVHAKFGGIHEG